MRSGRSQISTRHAPHIRHDFLTFTTEQNDLITALIWPEPGILRLLAMSLSESLAEAERNFNNSVVNLRKLLPKKSYVTPDGTKLLDTGSLSIPEVIEEDFESFMNTLATRTRLSKKNQTVRDVAMKWFQASYPFMRIILTVGKSTSSVYDILHPLLTR